jgi:hypothetical protein
MRSDTRDIINNAFLQHQDPLPFNIIPVHRSASMPQIPPATFFKNSCLKATVEESGHHIIGKKFYPAIHVMTDEPLFYSRLLMREQVPVRGMQIQSHHPRCVLARTHTPGQEARPNGQH